MAGEQGQLCHQLQHVLGRAVRRSKLMWPKCINCVNSCYTLGHFKMLLGVESYLTEYLLEQHKHNFTQFCSDIQVSQTTMDGLSLKEVKARLDGALSDLFKWKMTMIFKFPSNPRHSVIL